MYMARSKNTRAEVTNAYEHAVDKVGNGNTYKKKTKKQYMIYQPIYDSVSKHGNQRKGGTEMNIQQHQDLAFL